MPSASSQHAAEELRAFHLRAHCRTADPEHRRKIRFNMGNYDRAVTARKKAQYHDWQAARRHAAAIRRHALSRLPELLTTLETNLTARGTQVLWAETAAQARDHILRLAREHHVHKVVKGKSMTSEEIDLLATLTAAGIETWETDLGEFIVQLADEKPYHIVTPAMHKSRHDIAALFHEKLGTPPDASPEALTRAARRFLRQHFVTADMGITGANFLVADPGAIVLCENESNGRLSAACPDIHVALVGIEKVIAGQNDLAMLLPLLATSGTGQQCTTYTSIIAGPRQPHEPDGPRHSYLILLDNGRSTLFADPELREALACIRCGACLNACPVYRAIGGHAYNTTYPGPIGAVITPHLRGLRQWRHLADASSLCGACTDACPVQVPLDHLILDTRRRAHALHPNPFWKIAMRAWSATMTRRRTDLARRLWRLAAPALDKLLPDEIRKRIPKLPRRSFAEQWESRP